MSTLGRHSRNTDVTRWADRHGVIGELLPLAGRETDSIELARTASAELETLPATASTFRPHEVLPNTRGYTATILRALGAWRYPGDVAKQRWVNPNYIHAGTVATIDADRYEAAKECAHLGTLTVPDVAPRFGVSPSTLTDWLHRRDVQWSDWRRVGRRRFARTMRTAMEWGKTQQAVTEPWPVEAGTVCTWIQRYARNTDWEPPADPTLTGAVEVGH